MRFIVYGLTIVYSTAGLCGFVNAQLLPEALPAHEQDAAIMLRDGQLDSAQWLLLRDFYANPLNVPAGELRMLNSLFPSCATAMPAEPEVLAGFEPWSNDQIERFFALYPEFIPFKPILSFKKKQTNTFARIGCLIQTVGDSGFRAASHFRCDAGSVLSVRGDAKVGESSALWQRRSVRLFAGDVGTFTLGNFSIDMDKGLTYGHFPARCVNPAGLNPWQYSETPGWNGILYESAKASNFYARAFYHQRQNEKILGAQGIVAVGNGLRLMTGASQASAPLTDTSSTQTISYAHAGLTARLGAFEATVNAAVRSRHWDDVPVLVQVKQSAGGAEIEATAACGPASGAQLSAVENLSGENAVGTDSLQGGHTVVAVQCRLPMFSHAYSVCGLRYSSIALSTAAEGFVQFAGTAPFDFDARYSFTQSDAKAGTVHGFVVFASKHIARSLVATIHCRLNAHEGSYASGYGKFSSNVLVSSWFEWAPFIGWYSAMGNRKQGRLGFSHTLRPCIGSSSEISVEIPVFSTYADWGSVYAKANFEF